MKKIRVLAITPAFSGGSWICTERTLTALSDKNSEILCLGLGSVFHKNQIFKYYSIPFPRYDRWGFLTSLSFIVAVLWSLPLAIVSIIMVVFYNPKIVFVNGFATAFQIAPFSKIFQKRVVVGYHGFVKNRSSSSTSILSLFARFFDLVIVNSNDSKNNIRSFIPENKIETNEHYADESFFRGELINTSNTPCRVLYVGRLDIEKLCKPLVDFAIQHKDDKDFIFEFVGVGEYTNVLKENSSGGRIVIHGYLNDRKKLKKLFQRASVVWSCADEDYLVLPAIESLACGTPIIIPKIAALPEKTKKGILINKDLVPAKVGWLVDPFNPQEVDHILKNISRKKANMKMKIDCREFAKQRYSINNLIRPVERIISLANR